MSLFGHSLDTKQLLYSLVLLIMIISIPITVYLVNNKQILKGKASAQEFSVGFNVTGIIHYGYNDLLPAPASDIDSNLSEINRMGGKIIRVFVANNKITNDEAARRLDLFLTKAASYNISVIPSFINFFGDNGFYPQNAGKYYTDSWNGIPLLGNGFYTTGYKNEYLSLVQAVVSLNKNHSNIYAWEPGNELKDNDSSLNFYNFMKDISNTIKAIDPVHPISTGMMNAGNAVLSPDQLYSLPNIDIITIHNYNGARDGLSDLNWGLTHGKKVIVEEFGFSGNDDRTNQTRIDVDFWKSQGAAAVLQWGFLAKGIADNGNGDVLYGMDSIWHSDYDELATLYSYYNKVLSTTPIPVSTATPTPTLAPSTWIINAEPVCTVGKVPTGKTRIYYAIWPKYPLSSKLDWLNDDYAVGIHSKQIAATAPQGPGATQGIYVGMETESGENLFPVSPPPNGEITYATYFNPPKLMAHWFYDKLPSGAYNLKFQAKDSLCSVITPTPTCVPRPACLDATPPCMIPEPDNECVGSPTPTPVSTAPNPSISCNPNPSGNDDRFIISWINNNNPVSYADIAPSDSFNNNIFYNKAVTGKANSAAKSTVPGGFNDHLNDTPLLLKANTTYYVRLFNGVAQTQPAGYGTFNGSDCPYTLTTTPTATATPTGPTATPSQELRGDVNGDGKVTLVDMSALLSKWGKTGDEAGNADLNNDEIVNTFDYSLMLQSLIQNGIIKAS